MENKKENELDGKDESKYPPQQTTCHPSTSVFINESDSTKPSPSGAQDPTAVAQSATHDSSQQNNLVKQKPVVNDTLVSLIH